uniref:Uncharacterized protein n=3 Tax=Canis lupus TaxID=9612 RepID=A0A8C0QBE4_CANLF
MGFLLNSQSQIGKNQYLTNESISVVCWITSAQNFHSHMIDCDSYTVIIFILDCWPS